MSVLRARWVIPCFNEEKRLDGASLVSFLESAPEIDVLFVNDGSSDGTEEMLRTLVARCPGRIELLSLERNGGKAEAVRRGLLEALNAPGEIVGYLDADFATPLTEMRRLTAFMMKSDVDLVLGSRVLMLGRHIERRHARHYLGRVFATVASLALEVPVYDTQCGAKVFRRTPALAWALREPFLSRWAFDVELLGRLMTAPGGFDASRIVEEPLLEWRDVPGSKLSFGHMVGAAGDLCRITWALRRADRKRR